MNVVAFNVPTTGHVDPSIPLTAELVSRGHTVDYYLTEGYRHRVEAAGATFHPTPGIGEDYFDEVSRRFNPFRLATQLLTTTYEILPGLSKQLAEEKPDVVVFDSMCPWGYLAANLTGIPAISSMSLLNVPPSYLPKTGELFTALKQIPRFLSWIRPYRGAIRRLEVKYPVKFPDLYTVINRPGDLTINYTSASIHPEADRLGPGFLFVGPAIPAAPANIDFPFDQLDSERPSILVSLGTVFNDNPSFFQDCIKAFAESDYQVVMSMGKRLSIEALGDIPANFIIRSYVPQTEILKRTDLFITHGGVNSVHQGLYYGVPLLLVPQQLEQALVAARIAELGAGVVLRKPSQANLRSMAGHLLSDRSYRLRASALSEDLTAAGGVGRAADEIEALCQPN